MEFRDALTDAQLLAFSAMLMAGLDGIKNKIETRPDLMDKKKKLPPEEKAMIKQVPGSLRKCSTTWTRP